MPFSTLTRLPFQNKMASAYNGADDPLLSESMLDMGCDGISEAEAKALAVQEEKRKSLLLTVCFLLMIVIGLGNKIFQVLQLQPMENYPIFVNMFSTAVYVPISFAYIFPMLKWGSLISVEQTQIPKRTFFYMGALDAVAGITQTISINYIANGTVVILVMQMAIPISMAISALLLGAKYKPFQYIGCLIVGAGLAVVLVPMFVNSKNDSDMPDAATFLFSIAALIASNIPMCLSSVVKEKALGEAAIDPIYLNGWIALFQFFMSWPLLIPAAPTANVAIPDIWQNLVDGAKCYVGINTYVAPETIMSTMSTELVPLSNSFFSSPAAQVALSHATSLLSFVGDSKKSDNCAMSPYYVNIYIFFNILYNILIIMIIKYGSSNVLWLAMTVMVPLGSIAFSFSFMPKNRPLAITDIIGLCVILFGLVIYRFYESIVDMCGGRREENWAEAEPLTLNNDEQY